MNQQKRGIYKLPVLFWYQIYADFLFFNDFSSLWQEELEELIMLIILPTCSVSPETAVPAH